MSLPTDVDMLFGLATLIILEIVLGIDNLIFIIIITQRLPKAQLKLAQLIGLGLAFFVRVLLLYSVVWLSGLTHPIVHIFHYSFSARDLIMIFGGGFLLTKSTIELHEHLEGSALDEDVRRLTQSFWLVIAQIVVLDAIFSLDSVVTAIGMVQNIYIMIIAIATAIVAMLAAANFLMTFIARHPTVIVLCLGFLMMIGFSLVLEGFGLSIPKGYLYGAIGFSVGIEALNQLAHYKNRKRITKTNLRSRTATAVLRLLGSEKEASIPEIDAMAEHAASAELFKREEKNMIRGVLDLAVRPVRSIMTPRNEVEWLDISLTPKELHHQLTELKHSIIILAQHKIDEFVGVAYCKNLLLPLSKEKKINWSKISSQPLVVHENTNVLRLIEQWRSAPFQMAIVVDELGSFEGVITPFDILEAIAGDFLEEDEQSPLLEVREDGSFLIDASADIRYLSELLEHELLDEEQHYTTLAGYILWHLGHLPTQDESFDIDNFSFKVIEMDNRNISKVLIRPLEETKE